VQVELYPPPVVQSPFRQPGNSFVEFIPDFGFDRGLQPRVNDRVYESNGDPLNVFGGYARNDAREIVPWMFHRLLDQRYLAEHFALLKGNVAYFLT